MTITVTLLGTGSPRPSPHRSQPANIIELDGRRVLLDAGDGTVRQLMRAGISPDAIGDLLFTHMHKDHILGYPGVVWAGWTLGRERLTVAGPPGTARMHSLLFDELFAEDMSYSKGIGFEAEALAGVEVSEIGSGATFHLHGARVTTARTIHSFYNLAYRFDLDGRSVVFTGDTTYCEDVVELARECDLFVCEVTLARSPDYDDERGRRILARLEKDHCTPQQAATMAAEARVGHLVINHMIPAADTDWIRRGCAPHFSGPTTVGEDMMTFAV